MIEAKIIKNNEDGFIGVKEAAQLIGMSVDYIYKLTMGKKIPHYKIGKVLKFRRAEILEFMGKMRVECKYQ